MKSAFVPQFGDLVVGDGYGLTSNIQHFVDGPGATHGCVVTYPDGAERDMPIVLSAEYNGVVHELWEKFISDIKYNIWVYRIINATSKEIKYSLDKCERNFLNDKYAYLSWIWFGYCAMWKKVLNPILKILTFGKVQYNIDKEHNWYFKDCFCTEHTYYYMTYITELVVNKWTKLKELLSKYFPDTFQPIQYKSLLVQNPDIFKLVYQRINGIESTFE
jgi:hypothetical protein